MSEIVVHTGSLVGQTLGNFVVERLIGEGAMGAVYAGVHPTLERKVAIKALHPSLAQHPSLVARFIDEARVVSSLGHPGLVQVFDFGTTAAGQLYTVMELFEGRDLETALRTDGAVAPPRVARLGAEVAAALAAAHDRGIVHRDLKPSNLFLVPDSEGVERVKVLDFGIAKLLASSGLEKRTRTLRGSVVGTPDYIAPEQVLDTEEVDARADIYSLGCVLYEMLTGVPPHRGETLPELLMAHVKEPVVPPSEMVPDVPDGLERVVLRCLRKERSERYPSMRELRDQLVVFADGWPVWGSSPGAALAAGGIGAPVVIDSDAGTRAIRRARAVALVAGLALAVAAAVIAVGRGDAVAPSSERSEPPRAETARAADAPRRNPYDPDRDREAVAAGAAIWASSCAGCHGPRGEGDGRDTPPGLEPKSFADAHTQPGLLDLYRFEVIRRGIESRGRAAMPSFADRLSDDEVWKVVTFVATLAPHGDRAASAVTVAQPPPFTDELAAQGARLFRRKCSSCHGLEGRGDGRASPFLARRPADLTRGVFKLRSTPKGSPPTRRDLFRTLTTGMGVSGMPAFDALSVGERWALVAYVETLSDRAFSGEQAAILLPKPLARDPAAAERGRLVFARSGCASCHGDEGRGDGPKAGDLHDLRGGVIRPTDLTEPSLFIGGAGAADLYRTIMTGIDGTPMPGGDDLLEPEEAWDVVAFVRSLDRVEQP